MNFSIDKIGENNYYISFRGKAYVDLIKDFTKHNLYEDLNENKINIIYTKLEELLNSYDDDFIDEIEKAYNHTNLLTDWMEHISDKYIPSPYELYGLKELFKICYNNNLQIFADY